MHEIIIIINFLYIHYAYQNLYIIHYREARPLRVKLSRVSSECKDEQELYQTPQSLLIMLDEYIEPFKGLTFYDPFAGYKSFEYYLKKEDKFNVISRDKHTMDISHDFLTADSPVYDIMMGNPPWKLTNECIARFLKDGKPGLFLLPLNWMATLGGSKLLAGCRYDLLVVIGRHKFRTLQGCEYMDKDVGNVAWYKINFPNQIGGSIMARSPPYNQDEFPTCPALQAIKEEEDEGFEEDGGEYEDEELYVEEEASDEEDFEGNKKPILVRFIPRKNNGKLNNVGELEIV